jgi:hypothetical protein
VDRQLARNLLAVRDACGGKTPLNVPETIERQRPNKRLEPARRMIRGIKDFIVTPRG